MADNVQLNVGVGGDELAALDLGSSVKLQKTLLVNDAGVTASNRISSTSFNSRDAATLAASATFQGVGEDVSMFGRVGVSIVSDNATDGVLTMEVSRDNVTWGGPTRTWADTRFAQPHMWVIVEKYFRIKYVNGTTEATNLAIQTHYATDANILLGHQLNETLLNETEAIVVRSVLVGKTSDDLYVNVPTNKAGALITSDFDTETALGNVPGYQIADKFGRVKAIDIADGAVDIWAFADDAASPRSSLKTFPSSATTFYLASSSASDTAVDVTVEYIDSTGAMATTEVTLTGQTGVSIGATALDVNRMYVSGATAAVGAIYCCTADNFTSGAPATPSQCVAVCPVGYQQTQLAMFTVPLGKTLVIKAFRVEMQRTNGSAGSAVISLRRKNFGGVQRILREFFPTSSVAVDKTGANIVCAARSQIVWRLDSVSDNDTNISCVWNYELVDD